MAIRRLALVIPPETYVWEVMETDRDDFGALGVWQDVTNYPSVEAGWTFEDGAYHPPPPPPLPEPPPPNVGELSRRVDTLEAQMAEFLAGARS